MTLLIVHPAATWLMAGRIRAVPMVQHRLYTTVGPRRLDERQRGHTVRIGRGSADDDPGTAPWKVTP